jgi:hypothetical protein
MRAVGIKLFALLAALLLLLPGGVPAHAQFYCQMTRQLVASCCCGSEGAAHASSRTQAPVACRVADCCRRISSSAVAPSPGTLPAMQLMATAQRSFSVPSEFPSCPPGICAKSTQAQLAIGPPLFVEHCALLS